MSASPHQPTQSPPPRDHSDKQGWNCKYGPRGERIKMEREREGGERGCWRGWGIPLHTESLRVRARKMLLERSCLRLCLCQWPLARNSLFFIQAAVRALFLQYTTISSDHLHCFEYPPPSFGWWYFIYVGRRTLWAGLGIGWALRENIKMYYGGMKISGLNVPRKKMTAFL